MYTLQPGLNELMEKVKSESEEERRGIAHLLGEMKEKRGVKPLIELLSDSNEAVQEAAADALVKIDGEGVVQGILPLLRSEAASLRNLIIEILQSLGEKSLDALLSLLKDEDHDMRKFACDILGNIGSCRAVSHLIATLNDSNKNVASSAAEALGNIGDEKAVKPLIESLKSKMWLSCPAAEALGKIGDSRAIKPLTRLILNCSEENNLTLFFAVKALGDIGEIEGGEFLISFLENAQGAIITHIIKALEQISLASGENLLLKADPHKIIPFLLTSLKDEDIETRRKAIIILGRIKSSQAIEPLINLLLDSEEEIREAAAQALVNVDSVHLKNLQRGLTRKEPEIRARLAKILGEVGSSQSSEVLIPLLDDRQEEVRIEAAYALAKIGNTTAKKPLLKALKDKVGHVRSAAANALGELKVKEAIPALIETLSDPYPDVRKSAALALGKVKFYRGKILPYLLPLCKDKRQEVRASCLYALGKVGGEGILDVLSLTLEDESPQVRQVTVNILRQMKGRSVFSLLQLATNDEDPAVRVVAISSLSQAYKDEAIDCLIAALSDSDFLVRYEAAYNLRFREEKVVCALTSALKDEVGLVQIGAAEALGEIGLEEAAAPLRELLNSKDPEVVEAVGRALEKIENRRKGFKENAASK